VRFPICLFGNFDVLFRTVVVRHRSGDRSTLFRQVPSESMCTPTSFFIASGRITLCPDACATVRADRDALISIAFGCDYIPG
jgi:hypothetical protein